jgi:VanZ family protein
MPRRFWIITVAYCAGIWLLSSQPDPTPIDLPIDIPGLDKAGHLLLYGGLAAVVSLGMRRSGRAVTPWSQSFVPILFATAYGLTDEIHQLFVPLREFDLADLFADTAGAALAQAALCFRWYARGARSAERRPSNT